MSDPIGEIRDMEPELKAKFEALSIRNTQQFLEHAHTVGQRTELAHKVGMTQHVIKELVNRADLMRINGVGTVFANLLEDAGVNKLLKAIVKFGFLDLKNDVKPLNFFRLE